MEISRETKKHLMQIIAFAILLYCGIEHLDIVIAVFRFVTWDCYAICDRRHYRVHPECSDEKNRKAFVCKKSKGREVPQTSCLSVDAAVRDRRVYARVDGDCARAWKYGFDADGADSGCLPAGAAVARRTAGAMAGASAGDRGA